MAAEEVGYRLCEPIVIFNILNQTDINYPRLSDPNYLLLLDTRKRKDFNESHVLTARYAPRNDSGSFVVPYEAELQTKRHCIVYDGHTSSAHDKGSPGISCARLLWDMGSKNPVIIIKGGYEHFSALYPFLRTKKIIYTQRELDSIETFPIEIIPGFLYCGTLEQSQSDVINKELKVRSCVKISTSQDIVPTTESYPAKSTNIFNIPVEDTPDADIFSYFQDAMEFIGNENDHPGRTVLLCSSLNISRSIALTIAYLMWAKKWSLEKAYSYVKNCKQNMQPNRSFIKQLSRWEEKLFGEVITDISEPTY